jgi:hypothetical protein
MSDKEQRRQWAEHLRDEADALKGQQASAGGSHRPVAGPLPHSADDLTAAVAAAVAAERERCARIAEHWGAEERIGPAFGAFSPPELRAAATVARRIAGDIRASAPPQA